LPVYHFPLRLELNQRPALNVTLVVTTPDPPLLACGGIVGLLAAAMGIDKYAPGEREQLARFRPLRLITISLPRRDRRGTGRFIRRLDDFHTVTGIRRASGKVDDAATLRTFRQYLLDARFGVLFEGRAALLEEIAAALRNPKWGVWLGRKCCLPASPLFVTLAATRREAWRALLTRTGYCGGEPLEQFDHVVEVAASEAGASLLEDAPIGFGNPIGERHGPRWIRRVPGSAVRDLPP
jgi:CRISPR system Cascade subunit CasD